MTRRDFTRVVYELLLLSRNGISMSQLVRHANLNSQLAKRYSSFLINLNMIRIVPRWDGAEVCELTPKGKHMLQLLADVQPEFAFPQPRLHPLGETLPYLESRVKGPSRSGLEGTAIKESLYYRFRTKMSIAASFASFAAGLGLGYFVP